MNKEAQPQPKPIIEVVSLSKIYRGKETETPALLDLSLQIMPKEIYGIIGSSGAGKSTLLRSLVGLIRPSSGRIEFHGQDIGKFKAKALRQFHRKIGMVFQHFNLLSSRTVEGNIAYPMEIAHTLKPDQDRRIEELLHLVGLSSKKEAYPASLSGGEKQRVGIARALANHPEIVFCDEATSALDPKTTKDILDLLKNINQKLGVTIVLITHDMDVIKRICHKVAVIEAGRIVEEGEVSQIFSEPQHPITKHFIQGSSREIPSEFFQPLSPNRKLLRLRFKGEAAGEPLISQIVQQFQVHANILLGWIDRLQTTTVGTLIIELKGEAQGIVQALQYLKQKGVFYEEIKQHEL